LLDYFIENSLLIYLLEIGAAVAGSIYLRKVITPAPYSRLFVWYLWLIVIVELIGFYPTYNFFTDFSHMPFVKGTVFERNSWLYNSYNIIKFAIFYIFFTGQLQNKKSIILFKGVTGFFVLSAVFNLLMTDVFFYKSSAYTYITGSFILMVLIFVYYFELLKSDRILYFYRSLVFYISVGLLLWHVTITPLFIYNKYFTSASPEFVKLHSTVLGASNYFLYSIYIIAFIICASKEKNVPESGPSHNIKEIFLKSRRPN